MTDVAYQTVVQRSRQVVQVQPDIEGRLGWDGDLEAKTLETFEDVVALVLEVPLQCKLFLVDVGRVQKRDSCKLQANETISTHSTTLTPRTRTDG